MFVYEYSLRSKNVVTERFPEKSIWCSIDHMSAGCGVESARTRPDDDRMSLVLPKKQPSG